MPIHKNIDTIQALRGIAVILVIIFHLMTVEIKYGGIHTIIPNLFHFSMFGVDLFFVISGFIMVIISQGKFQNPKETISFLYNRISRIYPTYWFYTFLILGVYLVKPTWVNSAQGSQIDILNSILLFPSDTLPIVMVGWTLIHEIYFYIVFSFILFLYLNVYYLNHLYFGELLLLYLMFSMILVHLSSI
jgi:peptidoglycan/LPS O-acetylase OafA/YrhL